MWDRTGLLVWAVLGLAATAGSAGAAQDSGAVLVRVNGRARVTVTDLVRRFDQDHPALPVDSLTPARVAGFLDLLADEAALIEAARNARLPWSSADSAEHRGLLDRLVLGAVLDSALADARRSLGGADSIDAETLGLRARERTVAGLAVTYDDAVVARLARAWSALPKPKADSSLNAQLRVLGSVPSLAAADTSAVAARSRAGDVLARDVIGSWSRLSVAYRPRIDTPEQVRDLIDNLLFERTLRARAGTLAVERIPGAAERLEAHAERLSLARLLDRDVMANLDPDERTLSTWFAARESLWALPARVRGVRLTFSERAAAERMALTLRSRAAAESLVAQARRHGIDYRFEASEASDPELFREAARDESPGFVIGPRHRDDGWWVARVDEVLPARRRSLAEVRQDAADRWRSEEAERRTRAYAAELRRSLRVEVTAGGVDDAVARLRSRRADEVAHTAP